MMRKIDRVERAGCRGTWRARGESRDKEGRRGCMDWGMGEDGNGNSGKRWTASRIGCRIAHKSQTQRREHAHGEGSEPQRHGRTAELGHGGEHGTAAGRARVNRERTGRKEETKETRGAGLESA
ncbi:hypothetical protein DFH09DRAFT_1086951 [Mycena vulgaris]|nr:hypothetical protein DFH09DRAFT_1086951 [Mycena vulgaris]